MPIVFGLVLIWFPPPSLGQAAASTGMTFVTGGLAALGVTVTIPKVAENFYKQGYGDKAANKESMF